jgi:acetyl esterase/lipase
MRSRGAWRAAFLLACLASGCALPLAREVAYGGRGLHLDVYRPLWLGKPAPVVVFFHGGSWRVGSRESVSFVGRALAESGFVAVVPDYRLYPPARFPDFVTDGGDAVRWAIANAGKEGGDPDRIIVMGYSAGAHIALMLALDERYLGSDRQNVRAAVGLAGPYDFTPTLRLQPVFGESEPESFLPIAHVDGAAPPVLLVTGLVDEVVSPENSFRLARAIRAHGGDVELAVYSRAGHAFPLDELRWPRRMMSAMLERIRGFIERTTR